MTSHWPSLTERFPGLRIAVPEERLRWKTGLVVRGLAELPVAWTPCAPRR